MLISPYREIKLVGRRRLKKWTIFDWKVETDRKAGTTFVLGFLRRETLFGSSHEVTCRKFGQKKDVSKNNSHKPPFLSVLQRNCRVGDNIFTFTSVGCAKPSLLKILNKKKFVSFYSDAKLAET